MRLLFLYIGEGQTFDLDKLIGDLRDIEGVSEINGANFSSSLLACDYQFGENMTVLRLESNDLGTLSLNGINDASLQLALELQKREPRPLRAFDDGYFFHFSLESVNSLDDFKQKISNRYFDNAAQAMEATPQAA